ncbi:ABC transporter ATP-binding protein, partial [Bacteroides caccae]|uniref:ABC transporter ATP-binding protein n=3 Tax=Pseudomonadati TaxID=3379134 RepID=UPI001230AB92
GINAVDHPNEVRPLIGWMPDYFHPYKNTSVREYLDFFARAYDIPGSRLLFAVDEVLDFTELGELQTRLINKLSKGQTQRLCLARTLVSDPELLILDEPAAGLDPKARMEFKNLVHLLKARGKTLLISSHILSELGEMCDSLIFMDGGSIVHDGDKSSLLHHQEETGWPFEVKIAGENTAPLEEWMAIHPGWKVRSVQENGVTATFSSCEPELVARELRQLCADLPVIEFHRSERRLEEAFVDILLNKNKKPDSASGQTVSPSSSAS